MIKMSKFGTFNNITMEQQFQSLTIFDFQAKFPDEKSCLSYLAELKWLDGYAYPKCGNAKYCIGDREFSRQSAKCHHIACTTSGTLFHKVKFSILKAFYIAYYANTNRKSILNKELSRNLRIMPENCWMFKQKVMNAMKSSRQFKITGKAEVDETVAGGQEEGVCSRKNDKKKLLVFAIERKGKGVSRVYRKVIARSSAKELGTFMKATIDADTQIKTDKWTGYKPLKNDSAHLPQELSGKKRENFQNLHRVIMGFKGWLKGDIPPNRSHLQAYIDEYSYPFNRNNMKGGIFGNLPRRKVKAKPLAYNFLLLKCLIQN